MAVRAFTAALNGKMRVSYKPPEFAVDHVVVGGGVVGLAIVQRLYERFPGRSIFLLERNKTVGEETSSRNSEVIHAGLYYPPNSLKTRLCIRGRQLLYARCQEKKISHRKTGKLVVAHNHQSGYVKDLHAKASRLRGALNHDELPTRLISGDEARVLEPNLSPEISVALYSPDTGIVDSHSLMSSLEADINDSGGAKVVTQTRVVRVDPFKPIPGLDFTENGWVVQMITGDNGSDALFTQSLINASGLSGPLILNGLLPRESRIPMYYARGSYASYNDPSMSPISHLVYPCPETGGNKHSFQSLGTHLTLDLQGKIRFGPDIEWLHPPSDESSDDEHIDFWKEHLIPDESKLEEMHRSITEYFPRIRLEKLRPDYVGIRPKLVPPGGGFQDFIIRTDFSTSFLGSNERKGQMISLLGIESPGLTSCLAIAEEVVDKVLV